MTQPERTGNGTDGPPSTPGSGPPATAAGGDAPTGPSAEHCGRFWLDLLAHSGEALTLTVLAGHVDAYAVAGCEAVCGPLLSLTALASSCRPPARR